MIETTRPLTSADNSCPSCGASGTRGAQCSACAQGWPWYGPRLDHDACHDTCTIAEPCEGCRYHQDD